MKKIKIFEDFYFSNNSEIKFILGPCQIESKQHAFDVCHEIESLSKKLKFKYIFKSSFDKANRTSHKSKRGIGIKKGLDILSQIREKFECPVISDVHESSQCKIVKESLDVIQIPAFLARQTDLLVAAATTEKAINVKKAMVKVSQGFKDKFSMPRANEDSLGFAIALKLETKDPAQLTLVLDRKSLAEITDKVVTQRGRGGGDSFGKRQNLANYAWRGVLEAQHVEDSHRGLGGCGLRGELYAASPTLAAGSRD